MGDHGAFTNKAASVRHAFLTTLAVVVLSAGTLLVAAPAALAGTGAYPCNQPFGTTIMHASDWAGSLVNTGHDGATLDVISNFANGSCARRWSSADGTNFWGLRYQCTEFAERVADGEWAIGGNDAWRAAGWNGSAYDMQYHHPAALTWIPNNSGSLPTPGDLLIWSAGYSGDTGHVAVLARIGGGTFTFVGQNQGTYAQWTYSYTGSNLSNTFRTHCCSSNLTGWLHGASSYPLVASTPLTANASGGWYPGDAISFSFVAHNNTGTQVDTQVISIPVRGPSGQGLDVVCNGGNRVSIPAGGYFTCQASGSWSYVGTYTFWADWENLNGLWHQGQLGPNQQFTISAPTSLVASTPLTANASGGWNPGATISFSFVAHNMTSSRVDTQVISVPVRGPSGQGLDVVCNGGDHVSVPEGGYFNCQATGNWSYAGTYTFWADWEDLSGAWHQGQLGPNQQFTLSLPVYPHRVLANPSLNLRSGPGTSYSIVGSASYGSTLNIVCQAYGSVVNGSNIWDRIDNGSWASDYYMDTPNYNAFSPPIPAC